MMFKSDPKPCPVCIGTGKLLKEQTTELLKCDTCERVFWMYGEPTPIKDVYITVKDVSRLLSRFDDAIDKKEYWRKIETLIRCWEMHFPYLTALDKEQQNNG